MFHIWDGGVDCSLGQGFIISIREGILYDWLGESVYCDVLFKCLQFVQENWFFCYNFKEEIIP